MIHTLFSGGLFKGRRERASLLNPETTGLFLYQSRHQEQSFKLENIHRRSPTSRTF